MTVLQGANDAVAAEACVLHIKNMVCRRCIMVVTEALTRIGLVPLHVELGEAVLRDPVSPQSRSAIKEALEEYGFELIDDKRTRLVEQIKLAVIELARKEGGQSAINLSDFIAERMHRDYGSLSKLFSEVNGISVERYFILQKIERVKELLVYDELSISQIADRLNYSSAAHLSSQFRNVTGMSPSQFKQLKGSRLRPLDEI